MHDARRNSGGIETKRTDPPGCQATSQSTSEKAGQHVCRALLFNLGEKK
jgi:hypothetical protein